MKRVALALALSAGLTAFAAPEPMVRWAGQASDAPATAAPAGKLLNPNDQYWGDVVFAHAALAFNGGALPADGRLGRDWKGGREGGVLSVTFTQAYTVAEFALLLRGEGGLTVATAKGEAEDAEWETVLERTVATDVLTTVSNRLGAQYWARLKLPKPVSAARWRITLAPGLAVNAVTLWGDGPGEAVEPVGGEVRKKFPVAFESLPGADATTFSDHIYWSWQRPLLEDKQMAGAGAVWTQHDKWARLAAAPILPPREKLNQPVAIVMAQNEFEGALLTLTSLKDRAGKAIHDSGIYNEFQPGAQEFRMKLGQVKGPTPAKVKVTLRVAATLRTQLWGVVPGPLFAAGNKLCPALMLKYFTNGKTIADFPLIALPPCGSQIFWLEVQTDGAAPGLYTTTLTAEPGASVPVTIEVLPVTLPTPRVWVHDYSQGTVASTWPFEPEGAQAETVRDKLSRGISSFHGVPTSGTEAAEARRQNKDVYCFYHYIIPNGGSGKPWVSYGYGGSRPEMAKVFYDLTDKDREVIRAHVEGVVREYKEAGVEYGDWIGAIWDEPGEATAELAAIAAKWVHEVDPKVRVYINPAFPELKGFRTMSAGADCFVPFWGNWFKEPRAEWQKEIKPDRINAFYGVQGSNRSELHEELAGHYRIMPWHAFKLGLNGWAFYAYYSPRGAPYTDYDPPGSETDYQVVYPGPRGPVPSRQAEAFRDGWEDYRLLTLLAARDTPEAREAVAWATAQIPMEREPLTGTGLAQPVDFEAIRLRLLRTAARLQATGTGP
jgi:hypothetical protein